MKELTKSVGGVTKENLRAMDLMSSMNVELKV